MAQTNEYKCGCIVTVGLANLVIELCKQHRFQEKLIVLSNSEIQWSGEITA